ncbi:glycosyltransferase [Reinekea marinisedimentorum]|uniref:Glycosyltransferase involved in cell wall biosynthesis n=1 Tax=Reinekea marinisedimentorum TaxID=230495 RepID=A0A4R3I3K5_9GAMM|nr:glycosyltransferase [Reinekea marinisedimentorum]TCS40154.1 glycosyltransferase involved in cell wall biosynthesis [Reinekea marinisedimentorum]
MTEKLRVQNNAHPVTRILVISDAAPHRNGVGAYYADLIDELSPYVERAELVSPEVIGDKWQGGWMLPLPGDATQKFCLPNGFELSRKIRSFKPTVVVIPTPGLYGLMGAMVARRYGIKVIVGFHTWFEKLASLYWSRVQGGITRTYLDVVNKSLFRLADQVLANSDEMVGIARRMGAEKVDLMGTPLGQSLINTPVRKVPKKIQSVLFVGRLAAEKNLEAVIEAARACPDMTFNIAGDGPERKAIEQLARGVANVNLLGWVGREQIVGLIDQHDALVLPSKVESFGTVAMEAMVRERLVFVSAACGICAWPELRKGLVVVEEHSSLGAELARYKALSEFEIHSSCFTARKVALQHIRWNRELWLSCTQREGSDNQRSPVYRSLIHKTIRG